MQRLMSFDHVSFQGPLWHTTSDIVHPCLQSKGDDGMSYLTSSDGVCGPRDMMAYHAQHRLFVYAVQGQ